jgi:hypothetical protein
VECSLHLGEVFERALERLNPTDPRGVVDVVIHRRGDALLQLSDLLAELRCQGFEG